MFYLLKMSAIFKIYVIVLMSYFNIECNGQNTTDTINENVESHSDPDSVRLENFGFKNLYCKTFSLKVLLKKEMKL